MAEVTGIAWCNHTFNPWIGCQKVSPACDHCYAEAHDARFDAGVHWGRGAPRRRTTEAYWRAPPLWHRKANANGIRCRVFCASMADVFDNAVPETWRQNLWALIAATPALDWLLLTKRPQNILKMLPASWGDDWQNDWIIAGGESGRGRRAMLPGWARSLRNQCAAAGVPFFFKQWGTKAAGDDLLDGMLHHAWSASETHYLPYRAWGR